MRGNFEQLFVTLDQMDTTAVSGDASTHVVLTVLDNGEEVRRVWKRAQKKGGEREGQEKEGALEDGTVKIQDSLVTEVKMLWKLTRPELLHYWNQAKASLGEELLGLVVFLSLYLRSNHHGPNCGMPSGDPPLGWRTHLEAWLEQLQGGWHRAA